MHFLNVTNGSAHEARYLADVSGRLKYLAPATAESLEEGFEELCRTLGALLRSLDP